MSQESAVKTSCIGELLRVRTAQPGFVACCDGRETAGAQYFGHQDADIFVQVEFDE
jgi:hypothetical protein